LVEVFLEMTNWPEKELQKFLNKVESCSQSRRGDSQFRK